MRWFNLIPFMGMMLVLTISCSGSTTQPVTPDSTSDPTITGNSTVQAGPGSGCLWGVWEVYINPETETVDAVPLRRASFSGNFEHVIPNSMILFENIEINEDTGEVEIDIGLEHTFPALKKYTGFDVMGVFMGDGNDVYPGDPTLSIPGVGDQRLLNSDGHTRWFNANEFKGVDELPPMFGYNPGKYGTPGYKPTSDLNAYKFYTDGLDLDEDEFQFLIANADDRGMFTEGSLVWRHFSLIFPDLPSTGKANFHYAVIGHWEPNKHDPGPPVEVPEDFPPEANVEEAVVCDIQDSSIVWNDGGDYGGIVSLDISPWDWSATFSGVMNEYNILIYSDAWTGAYEVDMANPTGGGDHYSTYHAEIAVENPYDCTGLLPVWVECRYPEFDYTNKFGFKNDADGPLSSYFLVDVGIQCEKPGPVAIAAAEPVPQDVCLPVHFYDDGSYDPDGGTIVLYEWDWDNDGEFDEVGPDTYHTWYTPGTYYVQFRVTDDEGETDTLDEPIEIIIEDSGWARTWGGIDEDIRSVVALDTLGNVYVAGHFMATVDFDPGSGTQFAISQGDKDMFLSKFNECGDLIWVRTWGGASIDGAKGIGIDEYDNIYVTGNYSNTVDFDPGAGIEYRTSNGERDAFLCKFDNEGVFQLVHSWGGVSWEDSEGVVFDDAGNKYIPGHFGAIVDFDPGPEIQSRISNGSHDAFLMKFDSNDQFQWVRAWGGTKWDTGWAIALDSSCNSYITGNFEGTVDFDPGPGEAWHSSNGLGDVYLTSFTPNGNHRWAGTWGSVDNRENGRGVAVDSFDNVYVAACFWGTVDFDPGSGAIMGASNGGYDASLSKFSSIGNFQWVLTWGGTLNDYASGGVSIDGSDNIYVAGEFMATADFDPGTGYDPHTAVGDSDSFMTKLDSVGEHQWTTTWGGGGYEGFYWGALALDDYQHIYITGSFSDTVDFEPGFGIDEYSANGITDIYLARFLADGTW